MATWSWLDGLAAGCVRLRTTCLGMAWRHVMVMLSAYSWARRAWGCICLLRRLVRRLIVTPVAA